MFNWKSFLHGLLDSAAPVIEQHFEGASAAEKTQVFVNLTDGVLEGIQSASAPAPGAAAPESAAPVPAPPAPVSKPFVAPSAS